MPNKGLFLGLLVVWSALFHFLGNSTFGYINTPSLFGWLWGSYTATTVVPQNPFPLGEVEKLSNAEDGYCVLIPLVVLALLWSGRRTWLGVPRKLWPPALVFLALATLLHVLGYLIQQPRVSHVAWMGGVYALVGLVWGWRLALAVFFPFILLGFTLPVSALAEPLTIPLRQVSTDLSVMLVRDILGIDVIQQGVQIMEPKGRYSYEVAAACSGIRSLITLFALTTIYGFTTFTRAWKRALMVFLAFPLAIIGNVVRLTCIIVAAEAFGHEAGEFVHNWFGFVTFALALAVLLGVGHWLREPEQERVAGPTPQPA